ncbi:hypothetical protein [Streptomyces melanogenes]|uniref:hypothetical protein n=1 Tax=Streptomyces melanogenes TaxID=67326 RepID=UPI004032E4F1
MTSPAPSLLRPELLVAEPELRTDTDRALPAPVRERERRPDTERREVEEREERDEVEDRADRAEDEPLPLWPPPVIPVAGEESDPSPSSRLRSNRGDPNPDTTGARPQVSQYSSPPPMSS